MLVLFMWMILLSFVQNEVVPSAKFNLETVYDSDTQWERFPKPGQEYLQSIHITCERYLDPTPSISPWTKTISPKVIHIQNCLLPTKPLAEVFKKLNFDVTSTDILMLTDCSVPIALPENYTADLAVTKLELSNVKNLTMNFFKSLNQVNTLTVENMDMPPLVPTSKDPRERFKGTDLGRIWFLDLKNVTVKEMVNCEFISRLRIRNSNEEQISKWPDTCVGSLKTLHLETMSSKAVDKVATMSSYFNIEVLTVQNCSITKLPLLLMRGIADSGMSVVELHFGNNLLKDEAFLQFPKLLDLHTLDLSYNRLTGECLRNILPNVERPKVKICRLCSEKGIKTLNLDGNQFTNIFNDHDIKTALIRQPRLTKLSMNGMELEPDCLMNTHLKSLEYLGLASNSSQHIEILNLHHLPSTQEKQLMVDLRGRPVRTVRIGPYFVENSNSSSTNQSEDWLTNKGYKLVILLDTVDCNCNNYILQRALKQFPEHLYMPALRCDSKDGGLFLEEPIENLNCRKAIVNGCKRRLSREKNYTTVIDCSNVEKRFRWPRPQGFRGFNATGNGISSLIDAYLPDSLEWLDLRNNSISSLSNEELEILFRSRKLSLWLGGNPINCKCENRQLLEALRDNMSQIIDYQQLRCANGEPLAQISALELCRAGRPVVNLFNSFRQREAVQRLNKDIFCSGSLDSERPLSKPTVYHEISLYNCTLPLEPLAQVLISLNLEIWLLDTLRLIDTTVPSSLPKNYSTGLDVQNLELINVSNLPENFFASMIKMNNLTVEKSDLPLLPPSSVFPLKTLLLKESSMKNWSNCHYMEELIIDGLLKNQFPESWPENCVALVELTLENMSPETVDHVMISVKETALRKLTVHNCSLVSSPLRMMQYFSRFDVLDLSYNQLEDQALYFPELKNLRTLNLAHNKLKGGFLIEVMPKVPAIQVLILDGNFFIHTFKNFDITSAIASSTLLERLSLNYMILNADCFMHSRFSNLRYLGLRANSSHKETSRHNQNLKLYGFPRSGGDLTVDLSGQSYKSVLIDAEFHETLEDLNAASFWLTNKVYSIEVLLDSIDCDCNNDILSLTLRDFSRLLSMPGLRCSNDGGLFKDKSLDSLNCMRATVHGCKRRISRDFNYITIADCSYNKEKFRWPRPDKRYHGLNASGNGITSLRNAYLPEMLQWLDLRDNHISHLYGKEPELLFGTPRRRVWLSGNPIACTCDNQLFLNALRVNHSQIMDYDALKCADSNQLLRLISIEELCRFKIEYIWGTIIALAVLSLIIALLLRHYWIPLRMYLYARGYCLFCLNEEDIDEDRPFDAFISFAHGDDEYVMEELLPKLEREPNMYRVCVHYRDWALGEWIPAQIMQSVRLSKRTIIVLSKSFVTSWWGALEFRYAQASATSEGRSRLLVLVLDDVLSENLTPELQSYLKLNTYLRCDDPWFWEKLRYAMPRIQREPMEHHNENIRHMEETQLMHLNSSVNRINANEIRDVTSV